MLLGARCWFGFGRIRWSNDVAVSVLILENGEM